MSNPRNVANLAQFKQNNGQSVPRTVTSKLKDLVSVKDFGAIGDGVNDDRLSIQNAIDSLNSGQSLYFPTGTYLLGGCLLFSGTSGTKTGLRFFGDSAVLRLNSGVVNQNVAEITSGSNYAVEGLTFFGNKGSVTPPGTDISYRYFNGLYVGATTGSTLSKVSIESCRFTNCAYCGLVIGSGPVDPGTILPGVDGVLISNCQFDLNSAGAAGGAQRDVVYSGNNFVDNDVYGIVVDVASSNVSATSNTIKNLSVIGDSNCCLFAYNADRVSFTSNTCNGGKSGILIVGGSDNCVVSSNVINGPSIDGIQVRNCLRASVTSNTVISAGQWGINFFDNGSQGTITGNNVFQSGFDGIFCDGVSSITIGQNQITGSNGSGIYVLNSIWLNIIGNISLNNNASNSNSNSSGIRLNNSSQIQIIGNRCFDSGTPGNLKQNYGVLEQGTSNNNFYCGNDLSANKTGDALLIGSANIVIGTPASLPQFRVPNGSQSSPSVTFAGDQSTGIFRTGGGSIGFSVLGGQQLSISNSTTAFNNIAGLRAYSKASLPSSSTIGGMIYVTDDVGGAVPAFSDGSNWRRVTDRAIIS